MSVRAVATLDLVIARETNGTVIVTKIAMMAITTSISTSVKPRNCVAEMDEFELGFMVFVLVAFPVADDVYERLLSLPISPYLERKQVEEIVTLFHAAIVAEN